MISTLLAMAMQFTPQAQANLVEYTTLQIIVGKCAAYVDDRDEERLADERVAMPPKLARMLHAAYMDGLAFPERLEVCKAIMPETMLKAKWRLAYPLSAKPVLPDPEIEYVNRRFGQ